MMNVPELENVPFSGGDAAEIAGADARWLYNQKHRNIDATDIGKRYDLRMIFRMAIIVRLQVRGVSSIGMWGALWNVSPLESAWRREPYRIELRSKAGAFLSDWMRDADEVAPALVLPVNALHDHLVRQVHLRLVKLVGQESADLSLEDYRRRVRQLRTELDIFNPTYTNSI